MPRSPQVIDVRVYGGRHTARLRAERDESGKIVPRARVVDQAPIDRMLARGHLPYRLWDAGDRFRRTFDTAHLMGLPVKAGLERVDGSRKHLGDKAVAARDAVWKAMSTLPPVSGSCVWHVVGCGQPVEEWAWGTTINGLRVDRKHAMGVLISGLDGLAGYYKIAP